MVRVILKYHKTILLNMGKRKIHIQVDEEKWQTFLLYVYKKHGKVKGKIWEELSKAIDLYMGKSKRYDNPISQVIRNPKVRPSTTLKIIDTLASVVFEKFRQGKMVSLGYLRDWIKLNVSPKPKDVDKYMDYFKEVYTWDVYHVDDGYIKPWTFRRKDRAPSWTTKEEYLSWLEERGRYAPWVQALEEKEIEEAKKLLELSVG